MTAPLTENTSTHATENQSGSNVATAAKEQTVEVAHEVKHQARDLAVEARDQAVSQAKVQRDRAVESLRGFGGELDSMAMHGSEGGLAADLASQASERIRSVAGFLEGREPGELVEDLRSFARRRPGAFVLGALGAGLVLGRVTKSTMAAGNASSSPSQTDARLAAPPTPAFKTQAEPFRPATGASSQPFPPAASGTEFPGGVQ